MTRTQRYLYLYLRFMFSPLGAVSTGVALMAPLFLLGYGVTDFFFWVAPALVTLGMLVVDARSRAQMRQHGVTREEVLRALTARLTGRPYDDGDPDGEEGREP